MAFPTIEHAARCTVLLLRAQLGTLVRCECLNADAVLATNKKFETTLDSVPTLFLEFQCNELAQGLHDAETAEHVANQSGCTRWCLAKDGSELDRLWEARRGCYVAAISFREHEDQEKDKVYISDTCVPLSKLAECISETEADFVEHGMVPIMCCHIADGNFHCCVPYRQHEKAKLQTLEHRMISRALRLGGTVSGEHGVGVGKVGHILEEHGKHHIGIMRDIKTALDPQNILNPGKLFEMPGWDFTHMHHDDH